jgi:hypothetical protein
MKDLRFLSCIVALSGGPQDSCLFEGVLDVWALRRAGGEWRLDALVIDKHTKL